MPGSQMIMLSQHHLVSTTMHEEAAFELPMIIKTSVTQIGNTSCTLTAELVEAEQKGRVLSLRKNKLVSVDIASRKPTILPPEFHEAYAEYAAKCGEDGQFPDFTAPLLSSAPATSVQSMASIVRHSDLDYLFHANQGVFVRLCNDCGCIAAENGKLQQFDKDLCFYPIREIDMLHKGEAFVGDELIVSAWENPDNHMTINYVITKEEKEIFCAQLQYYGENLEQ